MRAYYNEHDAFAAAWLRELMKARVIAPGDVDERSIEQVKPTDLRGYTQCHFFAGIGVWSWALRQAGWPDDLAVWTGSCPCQPFSLAGERRGFADERHLWPAWFWLIENAKRSRIPVFGEQIASKDGRTWLDLVQDDMEGIGHTFWPVIIPACGFGAPHVRQRLYFVAHSGSSRCHTEIRRNSRQKIAPQSHRDDVAGHSGIGELANSSTGGRRQHGVEAGRVPHAQECRTDGVLGHSSSNGWEWGRSGETCVEERRARLSQQRHCHAGELGYTTSHGRQEYQRDQRKRAKSDAPSASLARDVDDTISNGRRARWNNDGTNERIFSHPTGFTNGFWEGAEWLYCQDNRHRPVEPGTFPLAHGATNRVGRLRGYGNAISAQQAQAFIEAYIETIESGGE